MRELFEYFKTSELYRNNIEFRLFNPTGETLICINKEQMRILAQIFAMESYMEATTEGFLIDKDMVFEGGNLLSKHDLKYEILK